MTKLTDLCDIQYGYAFDSSCFTDDESYPQLARIRDIKRGYSETHYSGKYSEEYVLSVGDLLIGMDGEFNIARWKIDGALLNQRVCKIVAKNGTDEEYLRFVLLKALKEIEDRTSFVTVKHLSAKELNKLELVVPDYQKQKQISGILSKLENVIAERHIELEKLDVLIKARFVEMFGDIKTNIFGWDKCRFSDVSTKITDGEHGTVPRVDEKEGHLYLMARNITKDGYIDLTETAYIPRDVHSKIYKRCNPEAGDLLLVCVGATIGKCALVPVEMTEFSLARSVALIKPDKRKVTSQFLINLLRSESIQNDINQCSHAVAQAGLYTNMIVNLDAFVPPIELQIKFADFVNQVDKSKFVLE